MEIHAPDHPIVGWRDTVKHLAIITAGVLIALTLEGIVAWVDHRLLVREAVANLNAELRANRQELDGLISSFAPEQDQLLHADEIALALLAHKPLEHAELTLASHAASLKNAAVTTGQITGAFGYMDYSLVRCYADVYDFQAQYMRMQEREGQHFSDVLSFVRRLSAPDAPETDAVVRWRQQIDTALAGLYLREQLARQLLKQYDEMVK